MSQSSKWVWILVVLTIAELAGSLETTLVFSALPTAMREFGRPIAVGWLVTGYFLVAGASAALCGRLGDLLGRSRVLMIVLALAAVGSAISAFNHDLGWIIAGRSIQGLAGAVLPLCYGLAREHLPSHRLSLGIGFVTGAASLGAAGGFIIGGLIVDRGHWQGIFTFSAILALVALVFCWICLPASPGVGAQGKRVDILGGVLFAPSIALAMGAVSRLQSSGVDFWFLMMLATGLAGLALWAWYELRHPNPLIDLRLFANREVVLANASTLLISMGAYQVMQVFPLLLQQPAWTGIGFGLTATMTGMLKLPSNIASAAGAAWSGGLCDRVGGRSVILTGTGLCVFAWLGLLLGDTHLWLVIALICASSAGAVIALTGAIAVIVRFTPPQRTSEATGVTVVLRMTFQALGAQITAILLATSLVHDPRLTHLTYPAPKALAWVIAYIAVMSALGFGAGLLLRRDGRQGPRAVPALVSGAAH